MPLRAILFDIGGVVVSSPMLAIHTYETQQKIPHGWINFSISRSPPKSGWPALERGEILLDENFFIQFQKDLSNQALWNEFIQKRRIAGKEDEMKEMPVIDAKGLFWEMMRIARQADTYMYPALLKLKSSGQYLVAALSNTVIFPPEHPYSRDKGVKDVFEVFVSSAHVGQRKPERGIYNLALEKMREKMPDLEAGEVLFLDDIGANLKMAREVGMGTLKVGLGRTKEAVQELQRVTGLNLLSEGGKL